MATAMEPPFSASLSVSTMRPSPNASETPSMADQLPSVNFGFDELREVMAKFTHRFDDFIAAGRKQVLEERNQFKLNVAELQEDEKMKHRSIEILSQKASTHTQTVAKEAAETAEMQQAIASITAARDTRAAARDRLRGEMTGMRRAIGAREEAQRAHAARLAGQACWNRPELEFWTAALGLDIEGAGRDDHLRFVFTHVDERDWERECWFELSTERRDYAVTQTRPALDADQLETALDGLNESRDLGAFLKRMRAFFVEARQGVRSERNETRMMGDGYEDGERGRCRAFRWSIPLKRATYIFKFTIPTQRARIHCQLVNPMHNELR